jgi:hypothetical protein
MRSRLVGLLRGLVGGALIGAGGAAIGYGVTGMLRKFGLCTGKPGLNPEDLCMAGSGASEQIMAFAFGGIAAALLGAAVLSVRGPAARAAPLSGITAGALAWLALTLGIAIAGFWLEFGPDAIRDYSGGLIAGIGFGLMSLMPLGMIWLGSSLGVAGGSGGADRNRLAALLAVPAVALGAVAALALGNSAAPVLGHGGEDIVRGDEAGSYFLAPSLRKAIDEAEAELAPAEVVHSARISVSDLRVQARQPSSAFPGRLPLSQLPIRAPERMIEPINRVRDSAGTDAVTLDDVWFMDWRPSEPTAIEWQVTLDGSVSEPRRFQVSRDGSRARAWVVP